MGVVGGWVEAHRRHWSQWSSRTRPGGYLIRECGGAVGWFEDPRRALWLPVGERLPGPPRFLQHRPCCTRLLSPHPCLHTAPTNQHLQAVAAWGIDYVVLTSVDRDDLPDYGAAHISATIRHLKEQTKGRLLVEALVPDFLGRADLVQQVGCVGGCGAWATVVGGRVCTDGVPVAWRRSCLPACRPACLHFCGHHRPIADAALTAPPHTGRLPPLA